MLRFPYNRFGLFEPGTNVWGLVPWGDGSIARLSEARHALAKANLITLAMPGKIAY